MHSFFFTFIKKGANRQSKTANSWLLRVIQLTQVHSTSQEQISPPSFLFAELSLFLSLYCEEVSGIKHKSLTARK